MLANSNTPDPLNRLNNVLFSHSLHPSSGNEWDLLFSVIAHQPCDFVCPICLFPPVAPRITKCGHIFCADCICQHLACSKQKICPVCFLSITQEELLRTDLRLHENSEEITFQKVIKNRHNCCCFDGTTEVDMNQLPFASQPSSKFSHFMLADSEYVSHIIEDERTNLKSQKVIYSSPEYLDTPKIGMIESILDSLKSEKLPESNEPSFTLERPNETVVFFQESKGRNIYLENLNQKMLKEQFGDIKNYPQQITAKILKIRSTTVTQRFRRQNPILGHLPSGAEVDFALIDLEGIVDQSIIKKYSGAIAYRLKEDTEDEDNDGEEEEDAVVQEFDTEYFPSLIETPEKPTESKPVKSAWSHVKAQPIKPERKKTFAEEFPSLDGSPLPPPKFVPKHLQKQVAPQSAWAAIQQRPNSTKPLNEDFPALSAPPKKKELPKRVSSWAAIGTK
ncbi:hypothetical protein TVAG_082580 [Trichomonas vaginalis G3]|uniref:RING-type domain-containing protein n=1 Tax=Trichomonas vaginalis (strain ATCC PRA-98 / G3) TaxID=412133 RepID=A2FP95_TRIV3|nr:ubiquitin-like protein transferase protein [Trichomonas vaginalis G3]EAX93285.1 hypothetical protein TVAG_082580 [Trichomonas vaginalis G3]KAI5513481.1 ubiquitin-like protein transferase protein [Trichomonas vaginalis G3]|eukprot:XP_001306215.1 hypothetical protein [Trichomonas vaginalis G3]